jgi:hypothetical protein
MSYGVEGLNLKSYSSSLILNVLKNLTGGEKKNMLTGDPNMASKTLS